MYPKIQTPLKLDMASQGRFPRARNVSVMARLSTRRLEEIRRLLYLKFKKKKHVVCCQLQSRKTSSFLLNISYWFDFISFGKWSCKDIVIYSHSMKRLFTISLWAKNTLAACFFLYWKWKWHNYSLYTNYMLKEIYKQAQNPLNGYHAW